MPAAPDPGRCPGYGRVGAEEAQGGEWAEADRLVGTWSCGPDPPTPPSSGRVWVSLSPVPEQTPRPGELPAEGAASTGSVERDRFPETLGVRI